jgi:chromosomal replication initiator protein
MQAIGNEILKKTKNVNILYVTTENFTNGYIHSIKDGRINEFMDKYRSLDVLLVDDIQFISGKEGIQEAFFHTFNELYQNNKQMVISSDRPPKAIHALESRLLSRFEWGMIADIMTPEYETRIAILEAKCKEREYSMDQEIINYIAYEIHNNVRELEGALNKIIAFHQLNNTKPALSSVKNILATITANLQKHGVTIKGIIDVIAEFFDISLDDIVGTSREKRLVVPRQICMFLMREELKSSFPTIGQELGGRDHTTAMHAYEKIKKELKKDEIIRQNIDLIKQKLYN